MDSRQRTEFRYCLGDLCLFRVGFDALRQPSCFDPKADPLVPPPVPPEIPAGIDAVVQSGVLLPHELPSLYRNRAGICYVRNQELNYYIDLSGTFEDYLQQFSSKTRSTILRKVRAVSGTMEFHCFRGREEATEFHKLAREVAEKTYQEKLFDGAIPANAQFVERMQAQADRDCFRGYILSSNGQPVSYLYLPIDDAVVEYGYLGYDPEYGNLSVGTVLLYKAIEQLFTESGLRYFDFTYGESQSKRLFGRTSFLRGDFFFFRWGVRNVLLVYGHLLIDKFSGWLGRTLDALGLRQKIRKLLRRS